MKPAAWVHRIRFVFGSTDEDDEEEDDDDEVISKNQ